MSKKLTINQLKMAAIQNNMLEVGAELYRDPEIRNKIKKKLEKEKGPK